MGKSAADSLASCSVSNILVSIVRLYFVPAARSAPLVAESAKN